MPFSQYYFLSIYWSLDFFIYINKHVFWYQEIIFLLVSNTLNLNNLYLLMSKIDTKNPFLHDTYIRMIFWYLKFKLFFLNEKTYFLILENKKKMANNLYIINTECTWMFPWPTLQKIAKIQCPDCFIIFFLFESLRKKFTNVIDNSGHFIEST